MSVGSDEHGRLFHLLEITRLDDIHGIKASQGGETLFPSDSRALALNFSRDGRGQFLEVLGIPERLGRKPTQDDIGCHRPPPIHLGQLQGQASGSAMKKHVKGKDCPPRPGSFESQWTSRQSAMGAHRHTIGWDTGRAIKSTATLAEENFLSILSSPTNRRVRVRLA